MTGRRSALWSGSARPTTAVDPPAEGEQPDADRSRLDLRGHALAGLLATSAILAGSVAGGSTFASQSPGAWFFGTPGGPLGSLAASGKQAPLAAVLAVYGGLLLLTRAWLRLLRALRARPGSPVRPVVGVMAVWAVPLVLAPPLFSHDLFSYAGLGEMVSHHINPYAYGTGVLGSTPFSLLPGSVWANTPSPYGPAFLWLDGLAAGAVGHQVLPDLVLLRLLAVAGLALVVAGLPTLARSGGADPATAVTLGAGSPLALMTLVAGGHNDALMLGLLVAALAVAQRYGPVPGVVLCALAGAVKAPALLGVVFLGWNWAGRGAPGRHRIGTTVKAGALALVTLGAVSWASGLGWGWLGTVGAAGTVTNTMTPVYDLSRVVAFSAHLVHLPVAPDAARTALNLCALAVAAAVGLRLVVDSPRSGLVRGLGLSLLVLALLGPTLWAWYLTWGVALLAPVADTRLQRVATWVAVGAAFLGVMTLKHLVEVLAHAEPLSIVLLVMGLLTLAVTGTSRSARAWLLVRRWSPRAHARPPAWSSADGR